MPASLLPEDMARTHPREREAPPQLLLLLRPLSYPPRLPPPREDP